MKSAILDTNFIISCAKQKIDFIEDLSFKGLQILVPLQVIKELKILSKKDANARLALKILQSAGVRKIDLKGKNTDKAIINYAKANDNVLIATLDEGIKKKIRNSKLVIREKKRLGII